MSGFQLLLLVLLIASVAFGIVATVTRDVRWLAAGFTALVLVFLCELVNSL